MDWSANNHGVGIKPSDEAKAAMLSYLQSHRPTQLHKRRAPLGSDLSSIDEDGDDLVAVYIDTAIIGAMIASRSKEEEFFRFFEGEDDRDKSSCRANAEAATLMLSSKGRYSELVSFLRSRSSHREALDLLLRIGQRPAELPAQPVDPAAFGPSKTVEYLLSLSESVRVNGPSVLGDEDSVAILAMDFSKWVLTTNPEDGVRLFCGLKPPLPTSDVMQHLKLYAPGACVSYLEARAAL
jgi:hypothetical protein